MTEILILADGTELYGCAEFQSGELYLYVHGKTREELQALLEDPEKTGVIVSRRNDGTHTYNGYTKLAGITEAFTQMMIATMEQPE